MPNVNKINLDLSSAPGDLELPYRALGNRGAPDELALLRIAEVMRITGLSKSALYRLAASGALAPVKLTDRSSAWVAGEVYSYIQSRIAERDAKVGVA